MSTCAHRYLHPQVVLFCRREQRKEYLSNLGITLALHPLALRAPPLVIPSPESSGRNLFNIASRSDLPPPRTLCIFLCHFALSTLTFKCLTIYSGSHAGSFFWAFQYCLQRLLERTEARAIRPSAFGLSHRIPGLFRREVKVLQKASVGPEPIS